MLAVPLVCGALPAGFLVPVRAAALAAMLTWRGHFFFTLFFRFRFVSFFFRFTLFRFFFERFFFGGKHLESRQNRCAVGGAGG